MNKFSKHLFLFLLLIYIPRVASAGVSGMCVVPKAAPVEECELGKGFLCVNTPAGGVNGESFGLRGTIDRHNSQLASVRILIQNEYTKKITTLDVSSPLNTDCWTNTLQKSRPFCLDQEGRFSATIPLSQPGPYTISVSASRLTGESVVKRIRTSRILPFRLTSANLKYEPDITKTSTIDASTVSVVIDLLGSCRFCDFIGASTGAVTVSVENTITDSSGTVKRIDCATTVKQDGGEGLFIVGVPTGVGTNLLKVRVCNAAFPEGQCPEIGGISFSTKGNVPALKNISPPDAPSYNANTYPTIPWKFTLGDNIGCMDLRFNKDDPKELCPSASGEYSIDLTPKVGINVATLARKDAAQEFGWTFGWGKIKSPFANAEGKIEISNAAALNLPSRTINKIFVPLINNYLKSDEFGAMLKNIFTKKEGSSNSSGGLSPEISIPKCDVDGGPSGMYMALRGDPKIDGAVIEKFLLKQNGADISLLLKGLRMGIDLAADENSDGSPDRDPLPLVVAFSEARIELALQVDKDDLGNPTRILLSSPYDDCSFKYQSYCKHVPTSVVPKNLKGAATAWGAYVMCDVQAASESAKDGCGAVNTVNAQTGIISEKILDAINTAIYCSGSRGLTRLIKKGVDLSTASLPIGFRIENGLKISESDFFTALAISVGNKSLYEKTPEIFKIPSAGIVTDGLLGGANNLLSQAAGSDLDLSLSLDFVNATLFALSAQGDGRGSRGILDFDVDENFLKGFDFDFVKECDEFEPTDEKKEPSKLCFVRPRVRELLGDALTRFGYFKPKQPLLVAIRGNRALGPRIAIAQESMSENILEIELGGIEFSFYAEEVDKNIPPDEHGNLSVKVDNNGKPLIQSMRPSDPDPWNGAIAKFDLNVLLALEILEIESDDNGYSIPVRILSDRTRLAVTPQEGGNSTMVPAISLISSLNELVNIALSEMSKPEKVIKIPLPREFAFAAENQNGEFGYLGLKKISFGENGISLDFNPDLNSVRIAVQVAITQLLHQSGREVSFSLP